MAVTADEQILARIGFAQRWLERARRYYSEGNPARSVLTLALADAEVRRALEVAGLAPRRAARGPALALAVLAVAALAAVVWIGQAEISGSSQVHAGPPVLRLPETSGSVLASLVLAAPAEIPAPAQAPLSSPARPRRSAPPAAAAPAAPAPARPSPPSPPPPTPQTPPEPPAVREAPARPALSLDELVELILTADRTLRREPGTP
ncbi:MAG: hypothetical protein QN155_04635 [Armatimonadota bacterium]|nr:hypothetical protein [Armatimonadota bacterium]MDR7404756.1 hypothetical protein [Armatimonadota bacterium]